MAYFLGEEKVKARQISLRSLKRIVFVLIVGIVLESLLLWRPIYLHLYSLQKEKIYWQNLLQAGSVKTKEGAKAGTALPIPTMDQLPDMIDQCCIPFRKEGVDIYAFNVERFGELRETGKGLNLDYGLVRLRFRGPWEGVFTSLKVLEEMQELSIHVQEVDLKPEGGETLLRIDFCTGMEQHSP